ncbi:hypothetical protein ACFBZI_11220 [Moraxella sp. ZJ142]
MLSNQGGTISEDKFSLKLGGQADAGVAKNSDTPEVAKTDKTTNETTIGKPSILASKFEDKTTVTDAIDSIRSEEEVGEDAKDLKDKVQTAMGIPWVRAAAVASAVGVGIFSYFTLSGGESQQVAGIEGRDGVASISTGVDSSDDLNAEQAEYLAQRQREAAAAQANSGETNAAVLFVPTVAGEDPTATVPSERGSIMQRDSNGDVIYTAQGRMVNGSSRFERVQNENTKEVYYIDTLDPQKTEWVVVSGTSALSPRASTSAYTSEQTPPNTLANASYDGGSGGYSGGGSSGDGGASGGGGGGDFSAAVPYDVQSDPDIANYSEQISASIGTYQQNKYAREVAEAEQKAAYQAQQQTLAQQRQQQAAQVMQTTLARIASLQTPSAGFGTQPISKKREASSASDSGGTPATPAAQGSFTEQPASNPQNSGSNGANAQNNGTAPGAGTQPLPNHIIRAGTTYQVVVMRTANSDHGNSVEARIINGPFAGSTVYGQMVQQGRNVGVMFESVQRPNPKLPILTVRAKAENIGSTNPAIGQAKRHYAQNYAFAAATSILKGYGDAYADGRTQTTIERSDGSVVTHSDGKATRRELEANIARDFSNRIQQDTAHLGNRAPTFIIPAGQVLNMRLLNDWDTNQTTSTLF